MRAREKSGGREDTAAAARDSGWAGRRGARPLCAAVTCAMALTALNALPAAGKPRRDVVGARDTIFQVSAISALQQGVFEGDVTVGELHQHGDFGLGTLNALDGEMVVLGGKAYVIRTDGKPRLLPRTARTPFAAVTFFDPERTEPLAAGLDFAGTQQAVDTLLRTRNYPYAIELVGTFTSLKLRSVPAQSRPYPLLADVIANQTVFELRNVRARLTGFRYPAFAGGINAAGYHFHGVTTDRTAGGHVLNFVTGNVEARLDESRGMRVHLPDTSVFREGNLEPAAAQGYRLEDI